MSKLLLIALIFSLILTGCKDKDQDEVSPSLNEQIKGKWVSDVIILNYYDKNNNLLHESVVTEQKGKIYEFDGNKVKATYTDKSTDEANYTLTYSNDKIMISITDESSKEAYEIADFKDNLMVWKDEYKDTRYWQGTTPKIADYATYTERFTR